MNDSLKQTIDYNQLLDAYESLLTNKQLETMSLYYREDLSYQEIADNLNITKSAIYDIIKRVSRNLQDYEEKLQLVEKQNRQRLLVDQLKELEIEEVNQLLESYEEETHD